MKIISTSNAPAAIGPYSQAIVSGNTLYASGQIAIDPATGCVVEGGIVEQAEQIFKNIGGILEAAGTDYAHVVKTTCFLTNMGDFGVFNDLYAKYFTGLPARSCVEASNLPKGVLCEVEVIAEL
jgi:2-iminobutanoate/2-iminopropanoate deaminase